MIIAIILFQLDTNHQMHLLLLARLQVYDYMQFLLFSKFSEGHPTGVKLHIISSKQEQILFR